MLDFTALWLYFGRLKSLPWYEWLYISLFFLMPVALVFGGTHIGKTTCRRVEPQYVTCQQEGGFLYGTVNFSPEAFRLEKSSWRRVAQPTDEESLRFTYIVFLHAVGQTKVYILDEVKSKSVAENLSTDVDAYLSQTVGDEPFVYQNIRPLHIIGNTGGAIFLILMGRWLLETRLREVTRS